MPRASRELRDGGSAPVFSASDVPSPTHSSPPLPSTTAALPALRPHQGPLLPPRRHRLARPAGGAPPGAARVLRPPQKGDVSERARHQEVAGGGGAAVADGGQPAEEGDGDGGEVRARGGCLNCFSFSFLTALFSFYHCFSTLVWWVWVCLGVCVQCKKGLLFLNTQNHSALVEKKPAHCPDGGAVGVFSLTRHLPTHTHHKTRHNSPRP